MAPIYRATSGAVLPMAWQAVATEPPMLGEVAPVARKKHSTVTNEWRGNRIQRYWYDTEELPVVLSEQAASSNPAFRLRIIVSLRIIVHIICINANIIINARAIVLIDFELYKRCIFVIRRLCHY